MTLLIKHHTTYLNKSTYCSLFNSLELSSGERLPERPPCRRNIVRNNGAPVARGHLKRQALTAEVRVVLPILAPVSGHGLPLSSGPFDRNRLDVAGAPHVGDENQVEEGVAVDGEPYSALSVTSHPART